VLAFIVGKPLGIVTAAGMASSRGFAVSLAVTTAWAA
jgi:hypothetical protein